MPRAGHIVAIAPDPDRVDAVVADLAHVGITAEVVPPRPGTYELEDETLHEHVQSGERGLLVGLGIGALIGLVVVLVVGAVWDLTLTAQVLLVAGIAVQGTMPAVMWRMGRADHYDDDPEQTRVLTEDDRLILVDALHDEPRARAVLERHGAVLVTDEHPLEATA